MEIKLLEQWSEGCNNIRNHILSCTTEFSKHFNTAEEVLLCMNTACELVWERYGCNADCWQKFELKCEDGTFLTFKCSIGGGVALFYL